MLKVNFSREFGVGVFMVALLFTLISTISLLRFRPESNSEALRHQILILSEKYVWALIQEDKDGSSSGSRTLFGEGPLTGGRFSQDDLSRTIAVVLEDVLARLEHLENLVKNKTVLCSDHKIPISELDTNEPDSNGGHR